MIETVATGLVTPRGVTIAGDGSIYVAEAGSGGDQCMGEGGDALCAGPTGGVSRIVDGAAERVIDGLVSITAGPEALGLSDIAVADDGSLVLVMNSGGDPADRARPAAGRRGGRWLARPGCA